MTKKEFNNNVLKFSNVVVRPKYPEYKGKEFKAIAFNYFEGIIEINETDDFRKRDYRAYNYKNLRILRLEAYPFNL
jgi:hypothetical protein